MSDRPVSPQAPSPPAPPDATLTPQWADPARAAAFALWMERLRATHGLDVHSVRAASADASFRRYLRVDTASGSRIIMDAPPDKEDSAPFVQVAKLMASAGLNVPEVLAWEPLQGFMLLSDLGDQCMMQLLHPEHPQAALACFINAVDALVTLQLASAPGVLPACDESLLLREMELFPQWYLTQHRGAVIDDAMRRTLDQAFKTIAGENLAWPSVYVHSDFMPRNLMLPPAPSAGCAVDQRIGILDFQDAVYGPITYDIASLMRDAFLSWEEDFVLEVTIRYWEKARAAGLPVGQDFGAFYRAVEWMGLQRHLRVAGVFARLTLRDGKPRYLADTPRFIGYIRATAARYRELKPLLRLVDKVEGIADTGAYVIGRA